jgi:hypothetical protein
MICFLESFLLRVRMFSLQLLLDPISANKLSMVACPCGPAVGERREFVGKVVVQACPRQKFKTLSKN